MPTLFDKIEDVRSLAQIVVETVREPLLVLDDRLTILVASNSFHKTFQINPDNTPGKQLFALDERRLGHSGPASAAGKIPGRQDRSWKASWSSRNFPASATASSCCMPARCWAPA